MSPAEILNRLEDLLVAQIPDAVKKLRIREPVYSLRIWYFGSDEGGDRSPKLILPTEALRQKVIKTKGNNAPHFLWAADELYHVDGAHTSRLKSPDVAKLCNAWYEQYESGDGPPPGKAALLPFREMVQRAARRLNAYDWKTCINPTPDFVVFAADGSHDFCNDFEEMQASVSESQIEAFRTNRLLGTGTKKWWELA
jgi:hypothetical protein